MELSLKGKTALVTGSSRGIGLGIAQTLLSEGCKVILNGRNQANDLVAKLGENASFLEADVTTDAGGDALEAEVKTRFGGQLDILVCNVGNGASVPPGKENRSDWQKSFETNFFSATNTVERLSKLVVEETGAIVCISSICGQERLGAPLTYSAAKAALNSYVVGLSKVLGGRGIRINAVAPGNILFEGSVWDKKLKADKESVMSMLSSEVALGKLGDVEDIASMVAFLSSTKAKFVSGTVVTVDGGQVRAW